jgi:phage gpG-like protein
MAMFDVKVEVNEQTAQFVSKLLAPATMDAIEVAIFRLIHELELYIKEHSYPDSGLHVRTGDLRRSIRAQPVERTVAGVRGKVIAGQDLPYAQIQEYGGTIVPVKAQYLAIPIGDTLTPAGVPRFGPREAEAAGYKTFIAKNIIFGTKPGEAATPLFVLKKSVDIPARPFMRPAFDHFKPKIIQDISQAIGRALRQAPP